mmetsp:Transcript_18969/g.53493  ORF Transcript_18969/g.53493 Transcript_18969/m.53493 type:complete len:226 (-) Transcript_18969:496-1173(-)
MSLPPSQPSRPSAARTMASSCGQEFLKSQLLELCDALICTPSLCRSPSLSACTESRTRWFSCTMCFAHARAPGGSMSLCASKSSTDTSRRWVTVLSSALSNRAAASSQLLRSCMYCPSTSWCGACVFASTKAAAPPKGTCSNLSRSRQSRKTRWSALPMPELNWSSTPHPMPTKLFSALLHMSTTSRSERALQASGKSWASSFAVAISRAALLDTPEPIGTLVTT